MLWLTLNNTSWWNLFLTENFLLLVDVRCYCCMFVTRTSYQLTYLTCEWYVWFQTRDAKVQYLIVPFLFLPWTCRENDENNNKSEYGDFVFLLWRSCFAVTKVCLMYQNMRVTILKYLIRHAAYSVTGEAQLEVIEVQLEVTLSMYLSTDIPYTSLKC